MNLMWAFTADPHYLDVKTMEDMIIIVKQLADDESGWQEGCIVYNRVKELEDEIGKRYNEIITT